MMDWPERVKTGVKEVWEVWGTYESNGTFVTDLAEGLEHLWTDGLPNEVVSQWGQLTFVISAYSPF